MKANALKLFAIALTATLTGCGGGSQRLTGTYQGVCHNTTVDMDANVVLTLVAHPDKTISGNISITGDLSGTSPITGIVEGNTVTFTSNEKGSGMTITWRGSLKKNRIEGSYIVSVNTWNKLAGNTDQEGVWSVDRM